MSVRQLRFVDSPGPLTKAVLDDQQDALQQKLIPLTAGEIRRLFNLHIRVTHQRDHHERWSRWRRRHQARARRCHWPR